MAISHKDMLKQSWSQLNDKGSWLFTHIANTVLDTKIKKMGGDAKGDTTVRGEIAWIADNFKALHNLNARFRPGIAKVQTEGDLLGTLRRTEYNTAASMASIENLVKALANVSGGQPFDEAKLLAGISDTTRKAFDDALAKAAPAEVTLKVDGGTK